MPKPLNDTERRVLDYLVDYLRTNTYQPSIREIGARFSIKSTKTVSELLQSLADKGWIERDPSRSRGVRVLGMDMGADALGVPFYGNDGATQPDTRFQLDRRLGGRSGTWMVTMEGNHLREDGILPGDMLIVEPVSFDDVEDGDLLLIENGGAEKVKRCSVRGGAVIAEPAVSGEAAHTIAAREAPNVIRGRVAGVFRSLRPAAAHEESVSVRN